MMRGGIGALKSKLLMNTKERIILKSIELFNRDGVDGVPLHRIAAELGMSPGNLTYHYKNKDELIAAIYPSMADALKQALRLPADADRPLSAAYVAQYQIGILRVLWSYRFFFIGLKSILAKDPALEAEYWQFHDWVIDRLGRLLEGEIEAKGMRPILPPSTTAVVATNQWYLWVSFLFFQGHESKVQNLDIQEVIYNGVLRNFSLLLPYCTESFAEQFVCECRRQLEIDLADETIDGFHAVMSG